MAEYIDKAIAVKGLRMAHDLDGADFVANIPAADVRENVKAHWIPVTNGRGGCECSSCHAYAPSYQSGDEYTSPFCPNCGADMTGGNDG